MNLRFSKTVGLTLIISGFMGVLVFSCPGQPSPDITEVTSPDFTAEILLVAPEPAKVDFEKNCKSAPPEGFSNFVREASAEYSLDPKFLAVTVYRESGCSQSALGSSGEIGLTQINPKIWTSALKKAGIVRNSEELWNPRNNLRAGAWILKRLLDKGNGNTFNMFRSYNGSGPKARKYAAEQKQALTRF